MALSFYALGYIYKNFADYLTIEHPMSQHCDQSCSKYLQKNSSECLEKSLNYYRSAYKSFDLIDHLVGKWMSSVYIVELMIITSGSDENQDFSAASKKADLCEKKLLEYCKKNGGIENSCHISREHGHDISIMSEIVNDRLSKLF